MKQGGNLRDGVAVEPVIFPKLTGSVVAKLPARGSPENRMNLRRAGDVKMLPWPGRVSLAKLEPYGLESMTEVLEIQDAQAIERNRGGKPDPS